MSVPIRAVGDRKNVTIVIASTSGRKCILI